MVQDCVAGETVQAPITYRSNYQARARQTELLFSSVVGLEKCELRFLERKRPDRHSQGSIILRTSFPTPTTCINTGFNYQGRDPVYTRRPRLCHANVQPDGRCDQSGVYFQCHDVHLIREALLV